MKKGISLVSLIITVVIMVALISTVTISGFNTLNNNKKVVFATEINMVQSAIDTYRTKNNGDFPQSGMIKLNVSQVTDRAKEQFNDEIYSNTDLIELYKIDYSDLEITSLRYGTSKYGDTDMYVVSKDTGKVYYAKGLTIGSTTYYTLTDELRKIIKANDDKQVYDGIIFNVSSAEWTSNKVTTTIRIPNTYTDITVEVIGGTDAYNAKVEGNYNVYTIDDLESNYVILVTYTKDGKENTAEYTIDNVDNIPPNISVNNIKEGYTQEEGKINAFLLLDGYSDTLSGVKEIKYTYSYIDKNLISSYFKTNGEKVYNNVIDIEKPEKYFTIYVEDNIGNYSALYYELSDDLYNKIDDEVDEQNTKTYVISYDLDGGKGTFTSQLGNIGEKITLYSNVPTKEGYTFVGWSTTKNTSNIEYSPGSIYSGNKNIVLYAVWIKNYEDLSTYNVTYNLNGGEGSFASQIKISGEALTLHADKPTKFGYSFSGWEAADGTIYLAGSQYNKNSNLELTAKWTELPSAGTITFSNGYSVVNNTINGTIESTATIPADCIITVRCGGNVGGNTTYCSVGTGSADFNGLTIYSNGGGNSDIRSYTTNTSGTLKLIARIQTMRGTDSVVIPENIVVGQVEGYVEVISITNSQGAKYTLQ